MHTNLEGKLINTSPRERTIGTGGSILLYRLFTFTGEFGEISFVRVVVHDTVTEHTIPSETTPVDSVVVLFFRRKKKL